MIDSSPSSGSARLQRPRTGIAVVAALLLAVALATTITARQLDRRYGPIRSGPFGGVYSAQDLVLDSSGPSGRLAGGPDATTQLLASLRNAGSHSVQVTAVDTDDVVTEVRWSELRNVPGGFVSGLSTPWHDFPARIPAHTTIRLLITLHRPMSCQTRLTTSGSDNNYHGAYRVHWKSLLHSHSTAVDDHIFDIRLC